MPIAANNNGINKQTEATHRWKNNIRFDTFSSLLLICVVRDQSISRQPHARAELF